ncbi:MULTISPECIES: hypothetical protein [unclassified Paenibacillus]|uniref:hypothetical protein n=1 Tax=unclassified Paenibacillus TaxID=185978 RepID=UPI0036D3773D
MRLSGLLFGGLLGAAATLYISHKRPGAVVWASGALSEMCSSMAGKAMTKMIHGDWKREAAKAAPKPSDGTAAGSEAAKAQIEAILESDPSLQAEVSKIKAESSSLSH